MFRTMTLVAMLVAGAVAADADARGGLLGFRVYSGRSGLKIASFIPGTSAMDAHMRGEVLVGDRLVSIRNSITGETRRLYSVADVFAITNQLFPGESAILTVYTPEGFPYRLSLSPSPDGGPGAQPCMKVTRLSGRTNVSPPRPNRTPSTRPSSRWDHIPYGRPRG